MRRLLDAVARWSVGKPKLLIWFLAALAAWLLVGALIALPFVVPAPASPGAADCARVPDTQARQVLRLVESWTGLPPAAEPPRVYYGPEEMGRLHTVRGAQAVGATLRVPDGAGGWRLVVVLPCRPALDVRLLAILAHELVHVLQHHAGAAWPPPEAPAERVQRRFLRHGLQAAERPARDAAADGAGASPARLPPRDLLRELR